ncbi:MAG: HAMP domain-containing sensor histidine kinase [Chloroflexota bacterium]
MLDIQRLENGSTILDKRATEMHEILADAFLLVQPIADHASINFQMDISQVPEVSIDADMIKRVVINLMENAVKYTPTGSEVTLKATDVGQHIQITVSDTGPGIPPEMLDSIFNKFSRVKYQNAPKGIGLGLAFCRLAVEAHGGNIWVESDGQNGSDFIFTIPLDFTHDTNLPDTTEITAITDEDEQLATTA